MSRSLALFMISIVVVACAAGGYWVYSTHAHAEPLPQTQYKTSEEENVYVRFDMEIFDTVMKEYWQKPVEAELAQLFQLSLAKAMGTDASLPKNDRAGTAAMLSAAFAQTPEDKKKALAVDVGTIVLANLAPQGRSGILSNKQEQQFRDAAYNIDRDRDLYETLGVQATATPTQVQDAYEAKSVELAASSSPTAQEELKHVQKAKEVLSDDGSKVIYDQTKILPSTVSQVIGKSTLYIDLSKVTPATLQEFINTLEKKQEMPELSGMIIDVRGNVGGTLDFAKYLLALFIGPNQYAFDLFHQGELKLERTPMVPKIPALADFSEIVILTDSMTQSTAELTAAVFKRARLAKIIGTKTRGWGSVENTFPLETRLSQEETYSVLLVHSLTLREDNESIEGRGVDPDIDISTPDWQRNVRSEVRSSAFADAIIKAVSFKSN